MKDILTILILVVLVFFACGISRLQTKSDAYEPCWWILYIPLFIMMMFYGAIIYNTYFIT